MLQAPLTLCRLPALATRLARQIAIGGKIPRLWSDGAAAFASCGGSEGPILCEASLFMRHIGAAFFGNLASLIDIHVGETTLWGHWRILGGTESGADVSRTRRLAADDQQFHEGPPSGKTPTSGGADA